MARPKFYQLKPPTSTDWLEPEAGRRQTGALLMKAGVPSTVVLRGSRWLRFHSLTLHAQARPLERNMAQPEWGTISSVRDGVATFLLPGPTRLERFGVWFRPDGLPIKEPRFESPGLDQPITGPARPIDLWGTTKHHGLLRDQVALTDRVQVTLPHPLARVVLSSPSLPSRISLGVGDDTPVQVLPALLEAPEGGPQVDPDSIVGLPETCSTRDLAASLNAAWQRALAELPEESTRLEVPLRLISATDGVVFVELEGVWDRGYAEPEKQLTLGALDCLDAGCEWPLPSGAAALTVHVAGQVSGGVRLNAVQGRPDFAVRVSDSLQVAQAVFLSDQPAARLAAALWLRLPEVPGTQVKVQVRLSTPSESGIGPAERSLATLDLTLPVDTEAYRPDPNGGVWRRAAFPKPVPLDGAVMTHPLYVVGAAGTGSGVPLSHAYLPSAQQVDWRPLCPGSPGLALLRNLARGGAWELQRFHLTGSQWLFDLELVPLPDEYGELVTVTLGQESHTVPGRSDGSVAGVLDWAPTGTTGEKLNLQIAASAGVTLRVSPLLVQEISQAAE